MKLKYKNKEVAEDKMLLLLISPPTVKQGTTLESSNQRMPPEDVINEFKELISNSEDFLKEITATNANEKKFIDQLNRLLEFNKKYENSHYDRLQITLYNKAAALARKLREQGLQDITINTELMIQLKNYILESNLNGIILNKSLEDIVTKMYEIYRHYYAKQETTPSATGFYKVIEGNDLLDSLGKEIKQQFDRTYKVKLKQIIELIDKKYDINLTEQILKTIEKDVGELTKEFSTEEMIATKIIYPGKKITGKLNGYDRTVLINLEKSFAIIAFQEKYSLFSAINMPINADFNDVVENLIKDFKGKEGEINVRIIGGNKLSSSEISSNMDKLLKIFSKIDSKKTVNFIQMPDSISIFYQNVIFNHGTKDLQPIYREQIILNNNEFFKDFFENLISEALYKQNIDQENVVVTVTNFTPEDINFDFKVLRMHYQVDILDQLFSMTAAPKFTIEQQRKFNNLLLEIYNNFLNNVTDIKPHERPETLIYVITTKTGERLEIKYHVFKFIVQTIKNKYDDNIESLNKAINIYREEDALYEYKNKLAQNVFTTISELIDKDSPLKQQKVQLENYFTKNDFKAMNKFFNFSIDYGGIEFKGDIVILKRVIYYNGIPVYPIGLDISFERRQLPDIHHFLDLIEDVIEDSNILINTGKIIQTGSFEDKINLYFALEKYQEQELTIPDEAKQYDNEEFKKNLSENAIDKLTEINGNIYVDGKSIGAMNPIQIRKISNFYATIKSQLPIEEDSEKINRLGDNVRKWAKNRLILNTKITPQTFREDFSPGIFEEFTNAMNRLIRNNKDIDPRINLTDRYMNGNKDQVTMTFERLAGVENKYNAYIHDPVTNSVYTIVVDNNNPLAIQYIQEHEQFMQTNYREFGYRI